jgi:acyl-homoserine-lactone acylase
LLALSLLGLSSARGQPNGSSPLAAQVEIRRTAYGVPHILAQNLAAAAFALAYVQIEDDGPKVAIGLLRGRGEMGRWFGRDSMESDFVGRLDYQRAVDAYPLLEQDTRDVYEGFAAGANRYIEKHPQEFPPGFAPHFTGYDIAARDVTTASANQARRFLARMDTTTPRRGRGVPVDASEGVPNEGAPPAGGDDVPDEGSNAWAFSASRTKSGHAILLRNPHLQWDAGYYEAHVTVPGVLDFYGDFRIGGPFGVIGGFNKDLGFSTTNNAPDLEAVYALDVDSTRADHYLFDGASVPLVRQLVTVEYRNGPGLSSETREFWRTPIGPVIWRGGGKIYVLKAAMDGEYRAGQQFLHMMRARNLDEWKAAMRIGARLNSNFTYADRGGHIFEVWNAMLPALPHSSLGDSAAVPAHRTADVWTRYVPFDSLPHFYDPKGGYVHNENDPPYYGNMREPLDRARFGPNFPDAKLGLRSQMAIQLIDTKDKLSLEDVIRLKHSYHMLLADRVKSDLVAAVRASKPAAPAAAAIDRIAAWDNTVAPTSRGGVLFELWWRRYTEGTSADTMFAHRWSAAAPTSTPSGLANPTRAAQAFAWAVDESTRRWGSADVAWGDVHRVRIGKVDVPVGGCNGDLGCFRVLWYHNDPDGKRSAAGGDGWILAVEFADVPRAFSVLAYGESDREGSPLHENQAEMFARGELKPVAFSAKDVEAATAERYHPGVER